MRYNPEKHHRHSIRLRGYDYSAPGYYYITICAYNRECIFGEIEQGRMKLNDSGKIIENTWYDLPNHNNNILLDVFIIMPNHVHGIIRIVGAGSKPALKGDRCLRADLKSRAGLEPAPTVKNHPLSEIVRQFKTFSTRVINKKSGCINNKIWQRNYFDHIIQNKIELRKIRKYIKNNLATWSDDTDNPDNIRKTARYQSARY